jgi:hypothetical protein
VSFHKAVTTYQQGIFGESGVQYRAAADKMSAPFSDRLRAAAF